MAKEQVIGKEWENLAPILLGEEEGEVSEIQIGSKKFIFNPTQRAFINDWGHRFCLYSGGYGCGKSLALYIKLIMSCMCFPENRVLLGRRTLSDIERAILPDLFELMPSQWYKHRVKDAVINFHNGSQIILFGLEALQQGSHADIKKAQQKLKSINLGGGFVDQLEEVEYEVFNTIDTRMRRNVPVRQFNATTNPANYWGYHYFVLGENKIEDSWTKGDASNRAYYKGSMLENKEHLPDDYIEQQLQKEERFVKRYVYGEWDADILTDKAIFAPEHVRRLSLMTRPPKKKEEGCEIWEDYVHGKVYQIGVDPSEGVVDPSSVSVISSDGRKVAKFNGKLPVPGLAEKIKFLYNKYHKPLIVPEANQAAILEYIKDLRVYKRRHLEYRTKKETEKLGFKTSYQSKSALINHFVSLLREGWPKIYDEQTVQELKTFVWSDSAKQKGAGAETGFHDDDVMSTLLGYWELDPTRAAQMKINKQRSYNKNKFQYL